MQKKDYYSTKIADDKSNPKQAWKSITIGKAKQTGNCK